ncbi:unnamed protein product, partial [Discosporangium mesarthrocarpum]
MSLRGTARQAGAIASTQGMMKNNEHEGPGDEYPRMPRAYTSTLHCVHQPHMSTWGAPDSPRLGAQEIRRRAHSAPALVFPASCHDVSFPPSLEMAVTTRRKSTPALEQISKTTDRVGSSDEGCESGGHPSRDRPTSTEQASRNLRLLPKEISTPAPLHPGSVWRLRRQTYSGHTTAEVEAATVRREASTSSAGGGECTVACWLRGNGTRAAAGGAATGAAGGGGVGVETGPGSGPGRQLTSGQRLDMHLTGQQQRHPNHLSHVKRQSMPEFSSDMHQAT